MTRRGASTSKSEGSGGGVCNVRRRRGCDAGFREPAASKEIEGLDELMDVKSLLSGLLFGLSVVAKAPSQRKVLLPLQPPGYWLRCPPVDKQH